MCGSSEADQCTYKGKAPRLAGRTVIGQTANNALQQVQVCNYCGAVPRPKVFIFTSSHNFYLASYLKARTLKQSWAVHQRSCGMYLSLQACIYNYTSVAASTPRFGEQEYIEISP